MNGDPGLGIPVFVIGTDVHELIFTISQLALGQLAIDSLQLLGNG